MGSQIPASTSMKLNLPTNTGSFVSYPEVKVSEIEFGIILRSYKMRIKLACEPPDQITFTPTFSNLGNPIISSVRRSMDMPCYLPPHSFSFHMQMEKPDPVRVERGGKQKQEEICCLYLSVKDVPEERSLLLKYAVNLVCACKPLPKKSPFMTREYFLDCGNEPLTEVSTPAPLLLSKHQHDFNAHGIGSTEYYISICVFDFSKAKVVPMEALRIMARKSCALELRPLLGKEWTKPFDVTIRCKGGYEIKGHRSVLCVRSRAFRELLEKAKGNVIHIMDLSLSVLKIIVHFVYTGELDKDWMDVPVEEIVYGAHRYELDELLKFFDHLMIVGCNYQNALKLLQLSERHSLINAKNCIQGFIEKNLHGVFSESLELKPKRT